MRCTVIAIKEISGCTEQVVNGFKEFAMGCFSPEVPPEHLDRVKPPATGWQIQKDQAASSATNNRFNLIILVGRGVVPSHLNDLIRVFLKQCLEQFCDFSTSLASSDQYHGFTTMVVDGTNAKVRLGLTWRRDHYLLAFRTPHGP